MRAGFGMQDITPPMGIELAGYGYYLGRRGETVHDPLYARAVAVETEDSRALILSCDVLGLSKGVCAEVFRHAEGLGFRRDEVMIVSIHTHTGPCVKYHEGCGYSDDAYVAALGEKLCCAVDEALADRTEVTRLSQTGDAFTGDHIYNRTVENGPVDRRVRGFLMERGEDAPIAMVSAACHGVFRGRVTAVSADFAGEVNRILTEKGCKSIYLNGLCGDIDPYQPTDKRLEEFAAIVANCFTHEKNELPLTLRTACFPFTLQLTPVTAEDVRGAAAEAVRRNSGPEQPASRVALIWEEEMLAKIDTLTDTEDICCKCMLLGGVPVLALPFEGFTKIGQDVRALCGREDALVLGCAEELLGYLPTKDDIARGAYAALESTFLYKRLPVVPGEAERLGETLGAALERILK